MAGNVNELAFHDVVFSWKLVGDTGEVTAGKKELFCSACCDDRIISHLQRQVRAVYSYQVQFPVRITEKLNPAEIIVDNSGKVVIGGVIKTNMVILRQIDIIVSAGDGCLVIFPK